MEYYNNPEVKSGIKNGHPFTGDDKELFRDSLSADEQEKFIKWVNEGLFVLKQQRYEYDSYALKHMFARATGIYMSNNVFKDAMLELGWEPLEETIHWQNWGYAVSRKSPAILADRKNLNNRNWMEDYARYGFGEYRGHIAATWTEDKSRAIWRCSNCGLEWIPPKGTPLNSQMNYCPKCGARIEEERDWKILYQLSMNKEA